MGHRREQAQTVSVTTEAIMRTSAFRRGVEDKRSGRSPNFDGFGSAPSEAQLCCWRRQTSDDRRSHSPCLSSANQI